MSSPETFAAEWMGGYDWRFGLVNRKTGKLFQQNRLQKYPKYYALLIEKGREGVYLTVNPMRNLDEALLILKLGWDFDGKDGYRKALNDAKLLRQTLKERWGCETLLFFTGGRGYHVYVWLKIPYTHPDPKRIIAVYRELCKMSTHGLNLETIDTGLDYPKHQIRAPFTFHQKTKDFCRPVEVVGDNLTPENHPLEPGFTKYYRDHGVPPEVVQRAEMNIDRPRPPAPPVKKSNFSKKARPCLDAILRTGVMNDDGWFRTMAIFEMKRLGVKQNEVKETLKTMPKYDEKDTDLHLKYIYNHKEDLKVKCETIASKGYCMGEDCRLYRWLMKHNRAPNLNPIHNFWKNQKKGAAGEVALEGVGVEEASS